MTKVRPEIKLMLLGLFIAFVSVLLEPEPVNPHSIYDFGFILGFVIAAFGYGIDFHSRLGKEGLR